MNLLFRLLPAGMSRDGFTCGNKALDAYWRTQAGQDQKRGFATVIIAGDTQTPDKVIGFYTLAAASVLLTDIPECRVIPLFRQYALDALPWLPPFRDSISGACLSWMPCVAAAATNWPGQSFWWTPKRSGLSPFMKSSCSGVSHSVHFHSGCTANRRNGLRGWGEKIQNLKIHKSCYML